MLRKLSSYMTTMAFAMILGLSGCADPAQERFEQEFKVAQNAANTLEANFKQLDAHVKNPNTRGKYESIMLSALGILEKEYPESAEIKRMVEQFKLDTTENGVIFKQMQSDFMTIKNNPQFNILKTKDPKELQYKNFSASYFSEVYSALQGINKLRFDDHFVDYINIVASLSTRVDPVVVDKKDFEENKDAPVGSQLVGNPSYGKWVTDPSTGHSSWSFFEMYGFMSLMDNMMNGGRYNYGYSQGYNHGYDRYRYDNYSKNRNWSYSQDVYAKDYASKATKSKYKTSFSSVLKGKPYVGKNFENKNLTKQVKAISNNKNSRFKTSFGSKNTTVRKSSQSASSKSGSRFNSGIRSQGGSSRTSKGGGK